MGSVPKARYCERAEQCVRYEPQTGKPEKLSQYNRQDVCERCLQTEHEGHLSRKRLMAPSPPHESGLAVALRACRRDFVIQLYKERGPFWEAIRSMRDRWQVVAANQRPDPWPHTDLYPSAAPEGSWDRDDPDFSEESYRAWDTFLTEWHGSLSAVVEGCVPEKLRIENSSPGWRDFVAMCVLFQPPDTDLFTFADYAMPGAEIILWASPSLGLAQKFRNEQEEPRPMVLPPIKQLPDPHETRERGARYWRDILETVWEVYLKPQGLGFKDMLFTALKSEVSKRKAEEWNSNKPHTNSLSYYIKVDEYTTEEDVRGAFRMLSAAQDKRPAAARRKRDRLSCVECAVLHDRHGWKYEQLADRYGWTDHTLASKYIKDGRAILAE